LIFILFCDIYCSFNHYHQQDAIVKDAPTASLIFSLVSFENFNMLPSYQSHRSYLNHTKYCIIVKNQKLYHRNHNMGILRLQVLLCLSHRMLKSRNGLCRILFSFLCVMLLLPFHILVVHLP